jgi:hypothetical protein
MSEIVWNDKHAGYAKAWTEWRITDDEVRVRQHEDVSDIIALNKYLASHSPTELTDKLSGWRWRARIPLSLDIELARKGIYKSKKEFLSWLNNSDNRAWALCRDRIVRTRASGLQVITNERRNV